ncbi:cellular nucleic acid-binding protein, partial [Trifolium medium]|nr:cellular nucleic acid-binding protein [Trifolium medium]
MGNTSGGRKQCNGNCYNYGDMSHMSYECPKKGGKCLNCGRLGHRIEVCRGKLTCFNCGEEGHKIPACKKPKKVIGKVFALSGEDVD